MEKLGHMYVIILHTPTVQATRYRTYIQHIPKVSLDLRMHAYMYASSFT